MIYSEPARSLLLLMVAGLTVVDKRSIWEMAVLVQVGSLNDRACRAIYLGGKEFVGTNF